MSPKHNAPRSIEAEKKELVRARVKAEKERLEANKIRVCKWYDILMKAEDEHRDFLEIIKNRAPQEDPRIRNLEEKGI